MPVTATQPQLDAICHAMGDATRRTILEKLRRSELTAGDLAAEFPISRPAVSRHLRVLRSAELVRVREEGRQRIYRLDPRPLARVDDWLTQYRTFWAANLHDLKRFVERGEPARRRSPATNAENNE